MTDGPFDPVSSRRAGTGSETARRRLVRYLIKALLPFLLILGAAIPARAQAIPTAEETPPAGHTRMLDVPQTAERPFIDGNLSDPAWAGAAVGDRFFVSEQERWPTEQTEVLVTSDEQNLYVAFKAYDREPGSIEALQTRRDASLGLDDQVTIELDPFLIYREISSFSVNAIGTQDDQIGGGRARQLMWRGNWQAATMRTDYGWAAEIAIPFDILNFTPDTERMGINFIRYHHRTGEYSRWANVTVRGLPEERGLLTGLQPASATKAKTLTFLPYVVVGHNIPDRDGDIKDLQANAGIDIRYQPRPNLTGVFSVFPDFSQVETAVSDIDFNYNEKSVPDPRPFFQEGSAYLGDSRTYFYSNRVPDFDVGAKAFGRIDEYQFGAFVARSDDERTDAMLDVRRQIGATRSVSGLIVTTDRPGISNQLYVFKGRGRESSGLNYGFDVAQTQTDPLPGDGSFVQGSLGWAVDYWSVSATANHYSTFFRPEDGLVARDLLGTRGMSQGVSYYRDRAEGLFRVVQADVAFEIRNVDDGRLQRRKTYVGGSAELRDHEIRFGASYYAGPYRPIGPSPGTWSDSLNDDHYWNLTADFNTRSSRFGYGVNYSSGMQGGGDYDYLVAYVWARPTGTTFVNVNTEWLENFGTYEQTLVTAGWDITPRHTVTARYINAYYGDAYRLAYTWHVRDNIDFFAVVDKFAGEETTASAKLVVAF
jgi:hypothetical protein